MSRTAGRFSGYSLLELLSAVGLIATLSAAALPLLLPSVAAARARGAARYVGTRLQQARWEAVRRATYVGFRFESAAGNRFAMYMDGNGDGLRKADIDSGIDPMLTAPEHLEDHFRGVSFGIHEGVVAVESGEALAPSSDPVRIGSSDILSFGPLGTSTSGTLYLRGEGGEQYAVRVLGGTGRVRVFHYRPATREWVAQ